MTGKTRSRSRGLSRFSRRSRRKWDCPLWPWASLLILLLATVALAAPPAGTATTPEEPFSATKKTQQVFAGRTAVLYEHACLKQWGPEESGRQEFWVVCEDA